MFTKINFILFLFVAIVYLFFASGMPWQEADFQLELTKDLLHNHSFSYIESKHDGIDMKGRNGLWYDCHGITNVLLFIPIAGIEIFLNKIISTNIEQPISFLAALTGIINNALAAIVFFNILFLMDRPLRICFYATVCFAFLTMVFPYSSTNYEGNLNMLLILSSLYFLFHFLKQYKPIHLCLSGFFTGLAICTREFSLIYLFCLISFILFLSIERKNISILFLFFAGALPGLVLWGWYNWLRTGYFYLTPLANEVLSGRLNKNALTGSIVIGLKGLLLSKGESVFVFSPILVISMLGWKQFFRYQKRESFLILYVIILFLLVNAKLNIWGGAWSWGPRYTLEITPLMMLPLGYWLSAKNLGRKTTRYIFIAVCCWSLLIQLGGSSHHWHTRAAYLLSRKGSQAFYFTAKYSQWWDSIKVMYTNLWSLFFGQRTMPGYDLSGSEATIYTSTTIHTWWNRLLFIGIDPWFIVLYLLTSFLIIFYCLSYIFTSIRGEKGWVSLS